MEKIKKHPGKSRVSIKMGESKSNLKIPKPTDDVKGPGPDEAAVRKSQEAYREMLRGARDPEGVRKTMPYRSFLSGKYWKRVLEPLTNLQKSIYLYYAIHCDYQTGEALISSRKLAEKCRTDKKNALRVRDELVKMGWLEKTRKASRCWYFKVLKI